MTIQGSPARGLDVLLVSMPFGALSRPSLGLSLLRGGLHHRDVTTRILYLNLHFARMVGSLACEQLSQVADDLLLGEWVFSNALFDRTDAERTAYLDLVRQQEPHRRDDGTKEHPSVHVAESMRIRVESFLEQALDTVRQLGPRLIGFTCLSQQLLASLALARRIGERMPEATVVLGGSMCNAVKAAEIVRRFPFVDAVVAGEADLVFPELVSRALRDEPFTDLQGVYSSAAPPAASRTCLPNTPCVVDLDALPVPNYDDYFAQLAASGVSPWSDPDVPFETARGCWWGERSHCVFCSLNGSQMTFRSKSPERALSEIQHLARTYPGRNLENVDNMPDMSYFRTVFPRLAAHPSWSSLFLEVPCTLTKAQVRTLRDMRVTRLQPGIESLSTPVLRLMRKATTRLINVQLLKWCKEYRLQAVWNLLVGFPGEPPEEYERMVQLIPQLVHFAPPSGVGPFALSRFSPCFDEAAEQGLTGVAPGAPYRHIYPFPEQSLAILAHYFDYSYDPPRDVEAYTRPVTEACERWRRDHLGADLFFLDRGSDLVLLDTRPVARERLVLLSGTDRVLYLACDGVTRMNRLVKVAQCDTDGSVSAIEVEQRLNTLVAQQLMLREKSSFLSLALPVGEYEPLLEHMALLRHLLHSLTDVPSAG